VLVDAEELLFLLDEVQRAVEVVAPAVVLAGELPAGTADLFTGEVLPHELVPAMAADVVEGADLVVGVADDDDRRAGGVELLGEIAADAGELLHPAEVQPRLLEDRLALELVPLG